MHSGHRPLWSQVQQGERTMKLRLSRGPSGLYYTLTEVKRGRGYKEDMVFQTDWDFPGLAANFGYVPCDCGATDGTVDCPHKTAHAMISAAADYLDEHEGATCDDPGYFA